MENINRKHRCAFTGHHPEKLNISEQEAKRLLTIAIRNAIFAGYRTFITGMAKGIDIWSAEIVLEFKKDYPDIRLVCALPYPTFYNNRNKEEKMRYQYVLEHSDFRHISFPYCDPRSYQSRNMWMIDNSNLLIAAFTGEPGGTKNTIDYAKAEGLDIVNILD